MKLNQVNCEWGARDHVSGPAKCCAVRDNDQRHVRMRNEWAELIGWFVLVHVQAVTIGLRATGSIAKRWEQLQSTKADPSSSSSSAPAGVGAAVGPTMVPAGGHFGEELLPVPENLVKKVLKLEFIKTYELQPETWLWDDNESGKSVVGLPHRKRFVSPPNNEECMWEFGFPYCDREIGGTSNILVFLGVLVDTIAQELRLPMVKLERILDPVRTWLEKKQCTKRELLSVAGQLQHTATVVKPGRTFMWRLFDLRKTVSHPDHHVRLSVGARSDLAWWHLFLELWNGIFLMTAAHRTLPNTILTSDASGTWGCGGYWGDKWFQVSWEDTECSPAVKELIPIVIAAAV